VLLLASGAPGHAAADSGYTTDQGTTAVGPLDPGSPSAATRGQSGSALDRQPKDGIQPGADTELPGAGDAPASDAGLRARERDDAVEDDPVNGAENDRATDGVDNAR
jgi:hypothetical protein